MLECLTFINTPAQLSYTTLKWSFSFGKVS